MTLLSKSLLDAAQQPTPCGQLNPVCFPRYPGFEKEEGNTTVHPQQILACPLEHVVLSGYLWTSRDVTDEVDACPVD